MRSVKALLGDENIVAECSGVNYSVYVTPSRLLVGKRFGVRESYLNVPQSEVNTLELITKSVLPPLTFSLLAGIGGFLVWWFPGKGETPFPAYPYNFVVLVAAVVSLSALLVLWWRRRVAVLRIGIVGSQGPITVRLVSTSKAESVFRALRG